MSSCPYAFLKRVRIADEEEFNPLKLNNDFLLGCVEDHLESAVRYGVRRAYKHSEAEPPSEDQVNLICDSVRSALFEIFSFETMEETPIEPC